MKYVKIIGIVLACAFLLACLCGFIVMRVRIPAPEKFYHSVGETFFVGDFEVTVKKTERYDYLTFLEKFDVENFEGGAERAITQNIHTCMVYMDIKNTSSEALSPELYYIYIGDPTAAISLEMFTYYDMATETSPTLKPTIKPGETISVEFPYTVAGAIYNEYEGDFLSKIDLELTFSLYPEKHVVKLNKTVK